MIKVTVRVNTNERKYVTSSTKECRLFGILLYRKVYYYPEEGWNGEYEKQKGHETEDFHRAWRGHGACAHIRLFADVRELRSVFQEGQREGSAHTQGGYRERRPACEV